MLETLFKKQERYFITKNKLLTLKRKENDPIPSSEEDLDQNQIEIKTRREQKLLDKTQRLTNSRQDKGLPIESQGIDKGQPKRKETFRNNR